LSSLVSAAVSIFSIVFVIFLPPVILILFQDGYNLTPRANRGIRHNAYPAVALLRNCPYPEFGPAAHFEIKGGNKYYWDMQNRRSLYWRNI
jgi:hypothetical protein